MNPFCEQTTQQLIENFHRRLTATQDFYQRAAVLLAYDRMIGELAAPDRPGTAHSAPLLARPLLRRARRWMTRKFSRRRYSGERDSTQDTSPVVIIDANRFDRSDRESNDFTKEVDLWPR